MGWSLGYIGGRDVGYGVPAVCEYPDCNEEINRGLSFACGGFPGNEYGCGLFFCDKHMTYAELEDGETVQCCDRCKVINENPDDWKNHPKRYEEKPDTLKWVLWKLHDRSWRQWRKENLDEAAELRKIETDADPDEVKRVMAEIEPEFEQNEATL